MFGIKIKSLENGFLVSSGSCSKRTYPTLAEAICQVLDSLEGFGGYTTVTYSIEITSKDGTRVLSRVDYQSNLVADIDRIDNGFSMAVYPEPRIEGVSIKNYGFNKSGELIKQVFKSYYSGKSLWFNISAKKKVVDSVTCPGGPKITKRTVVVLEPSTNDKQEIKRK
jgi:hypothetical protein